VSAAAWTGLIVIIAIGVTLVITAGLSVWIILGARNDPDEQRWRREEAARREAERAAANHE
jgi:hypothetical protein